MKVKTTMDSLFEKDHVFFDHSFAREIKGDEDGRELGSWAEGYVRNYLLDKEFQFVAANYCERPFGEVDLIVKQGELHYFIEVKARRNSELDEVLDGIVTPRQYTRLINAAEIYSSRNNVSVQICLALLSIQDKAKPPCLSLRFLPLT